MNNNRKLAGTLGWILGGLLAVGCDTAEDGSAGSGSPSGDAPSAAEPAGTAGRVNRQEPAAPPLVTNQPEEPSAPGPSDPDDFTAPCVGPDSQHRERLAPTTAACDPLTDETHIAFYEGEAAIEAMRACTFEGTEDRRPYTAILVPRALLDGWEPSEPDLLVDVNQAGVKVVLHRHLIDGVTRCGDLPMGELYFGEGLTRPGESVQGSVRLRREGADRYLGVSDLSLQYYSGEYQASARGSSAQVFGVETLW